MSRTVTKQLAMAVCLVLIAVAAALGVGAWLDPLGPLPPQPIAFNHSLHLAKVQGITCRDCHRYVASQTYAGLPSKHLCYECHDPDDAEATESSPELGTLMRYLDRNEDIPWHRVTSTRDDVFFSHRRHVTVGEIECRECHPFIPDRTTPLTRGPVQMSMDTCIACHERHDASVDCISCHR